MAYLDKIQAIKLQKLMTREIIKLSLVANLRVNLGLLNNSITDYDFWGKTDFDVGNIQDWSLKCLTNRIQVALSYYDQNYSIEIVLGTNLAEHGTNFSKKKICCVCM